jgi:hypothetical protein
MKLFLQILALLSTILFLIAGFLLLNIESVSGDSIAESFYHYVGIMSFGFSIFTGGLLIALAEKLVLNNE